MINISVLAWGGEEIASTRYRVFYLKKHLGKKGIIYNVKERGNVFGREASGKMGRVARLGENLFYAATSDAFLIQKAGLGSRELDYLTKVNENVIYDLDDAMYTVAPWQDADPEARRSSVDGVLQRVPYAIVGSPPLAEYASRFCEDVLIAPTALPKDRYSTYHSSEPPKEDTFVVGWIGNGENLWYLEQIESEIETFLSERVNSELHIVTATDPPRRPLSDRIGDDVYYLEWSEEKELNYINQFDVGIRPLTDDEWTRAKGGFTSVIQCMAMGKPVVISPVGALEQIVRHGHHGYHASELGAWVAHLKELADDPDKRYRMGERAFERIEEKRFWTSQRADDLATFYKSIIGR